jgi:hypothetical protein
MVVVVAVVVVVVTELIGQTSSAVAKIIKVNDFCNFCKLY